VTTLGPLGTFLIGVTAVSFATPVLALSAVERPLAIRVPRSIVGMATCWWVAFLVAAGIAALHGAQLSEIGLLFAAAELAGAVTIWFARSGSDGRGGGGSDDPGEPTEPTDGGLPDEYWAHWEANLERARWEADLERAAALNSR
jgi:hypothetical protein